VAEIVSFFKEAFRQRINVEVLAGHPEGARHVNFAKSDSPGDVYIEITPKHRRLYRLDKISWTPSGQRSAGKAAAGAIAGTIVAGPLGTIAGAAIGGKRKDTSKAYVTLTDVETGEEVELHIVCDQAKYTQIDRLKARL